MSIINPAPGLTEGDVSNILWVLDHAIEDLKVQSQDPSQANAAGFLALKIEELEHMRARMVAALDEPIILGDER